MKETVAVVIIILLASFCLPGFAHAGDKEDAAVYRVEKQLPVVNQDWQTAVAKDPYLAGLQKKAQELQAQLQGLDKDWNDHVAKDKTLSTIKDKMTELNKELEKAKEAQKKADGK